VTEDADAQYMLALMIFFLLSSYNEYNNYSNLS